VESRPSAIAKEETQTRNVRRQRPTAPVPRRIGLKPAIRIRRPASKRIVPAFTAPWSSPRSCANRNPSAILTAAFAFAVGIHHAGGFERTSAREASAAYNRTLLNSHRPPDYTEETQPIRFSISVSIERHSINPDRVMVFTAVSAPSIHRQ
jgi:hypothetical protein